MTNFSLRARIFLSFFVLVAVAGLVIYWFSARQIEQVTNDLYNEGFEESSEAIFNVIEDSVLDVIRFHVFEEEWEELEDKAFFFKNNPELANEICELAEGLGVTIQITSHDADFVLFDTETKRVGYDQLPHAEIVELYELVEPMEVIQYERGGSIFRASLVIFGPEELEEAGIFTDQLLDSGLFDNEEEVIFLVQPEMLIRVEDSLAGVEQTLRNRNLTMAGATTGIGALIVLILGSWLANTLTRPLIDLRSTAQKMGSGQLDVRAETSSPPEIRFLAEDFNQMAASVENMIAEQRAFASNAAHELRTPLTTIRIRTEALMEDDPSTQLRDQYVREIHEEVKRLSRMVEDLRLLSRAEAQNLEIGIEEVNVVNLIKALQREFRTQIEEKQLTIEVNAPDDFFTVRASASHLRVMLRNVLENGIKYTPKNGDVYVKLSTIEKDGQFYKQIAVKDSGMGIPAEDLPRIFERFYRVDKAHSRKIPGSGLGLTLVRSIVNIYNGEISVESEGVGRGTTVIILIPKDATSSI